jgi:hypothetical protein
MAKAPMQPECPICGKSNYRKLHEQRNYTPPRTEIGSSQVHQDLLSVTYTLQCQEPGCDKTWTYELPA